MPWKSALLRLMDQIASAGSLQAVYRGALDCLHETLAVERASVLVFDASRTMRFVAWSGLSEEYRAAVDGHSPWSPESHDAATITVDDVCRDAALAAYGHVFEREGIRALAFVPLKFGPKLLGKFMLYYGEPHVFTAEEITTAEAIAGHVSFALEHHRIAAELGDRLAAEQGLRLQAQTEAALRQENERRLHLALDAGRMGAWEWDIASGRVQWSPQLEAIHGLAPGGFAGSIEAFLTDVHPDDRAHVEQTITRALDRPDDVYGLEYRIVIPGGETRWLTARGRVLLSLDGTPARMIGICRDATESKRAATEKAQLYEQARSAVRAREDMMAVVSHDLRNPLQSISAATALLRLGSSPEQRERSVRSIEVAGRQMTRLVDDLLDISRMDAGQFVIHTEAVDIAALLHETQTLFQPQAEERAVRVEVGVAEDLPAVTADRGRILQVLTNLIGNALKFAPRGGRVTIAADARSGAVMVSVTDTGMGIPPEQLGKVFERFWRGSHREQRGAGLGLAVAKGIVEAHGGTIGAYSRVGEGSTFYFTLPPHADEADRRHEDGSLPRGAIAPAGAAALQDPGS